MSLKRDESGRRWIEVETEVPGTPEEVWEAIATGPGVSSWFVPTEVREDGTVVANFGPGMESVAKRTAWEPPRRFAAESEGLGPGAPKLATEWIVEARAGGRCVVRVIHSLFASTDDWDDQLESIEGGWPAFFRNLRLYLTHFKGQFGASIQAMGTAAEPASEAWAALTGALGIAGAVETGRVKSAAGAPIVEGVVERVGPPEHPELLVRLEEPAPGIAHLFAMPMGGQVYLAVHLYLFGRDAPAAAAREESVWAAWMSERFPVPAG